MKKFEEMLKENNIKKPNSKLGSKLFDLVWEPVKNQYGELYSDYYQQLKRWNRNRVKLHESWGTDFPKFEDFYPQITLSPNPITTFHMLKDLYKKTNYLSDKMYTYHNNNAIAEWVAELKEKAPDNCKLIVIKYATYQPLEKNQKLFEESIINGEPFMIGYEGSLSIFWIAFKPDQVEELGFSFWEMTRANSTVEYISK